MSVHTLAMLGLTILAALLAMSPEPSLLQDRAAVSIQPQQEHGDSPNALAYSAKYDLLASAGADGSIRIWARSDGRLLMVHSDAEIPIRFNPYDFYWDIKFLPNGRQLVVLPDEGSPYVWDVLEDSIELIEGVEATAVGIVDAKTLSLYDRTGLFSYDVESRKLVRTAHFPKERYGFPFVVGREFAWDDESVLHFMDFQGRETRSLELSKLPESAFLTDIAPDGSRALFTLGEGVYALVELPSMRVISQSNPLAKLTDEDEAFAEVCFTEAGDAFVAVLNSRLINYHRAGDGQLLFHHELAAEDYIQPIACDSAFGLALANGLNIELRDPQTFEVMQTLGRRQSQGAPWDVGYSAQENLIVVGYDDGRLEGWNSNPIGLRYSIPLPEDKEIYSEYPAVQGIAMVNGGRQFICLVAGWVQLRESLTGALVRELPSSGFHFSDDGTEALVFGHGNAVIWNTISGEEFALDSSLDLDSWDHVALNTARSWIAYGESDAVFLYNHKSRQFLARFSDPLGDAPTLDMYPYFMEFTKDGRYIILSGKPKGDTDSEYTQCKVFEISTQKLIFNMRVPGAGECRFSLDDKYVVHGTMQGARRAWDFLTGKEILDASALQTSFDKAIKASDLSVGAAYETNGVVFESKGSGRSWTFIPRADGAWSVIDDQSRYDSSQGTGSDDLQWVMRDPAKSILEAISIRQLAAGFYTPDLFQKLLSGAELPAIPDLSRMKPLPVADSVKLQNGRLTASMTDRGGGIGRIEIKVNGQVVRTLASAPSIDIDLSQDLAGRVDPVVEVVAWNAENTVFASPRGPKRASESSVLADATETRFFALIAGAGKFADPSLNLSYSSADAAAMTRAVLSMSRGLGIRPTLYVLVDDESANSLRSFADVRVFAPSRKGFDEALAAMKREEITDNDLFLLYLAGHGVAVNVGGEDQYFYLTSDSRAASPEELRREDLRDLWCLSGTELVSWLRDVKARKRAAILDTCAAGALGQQSEATLRAASAETARSMISFQQSTGLHILLGCPKDRAAYELPSLSHGILTYALLESLKVGGIGTPTEPDAVMIGPLFSQVQRRVVDLGQRFGVQQEPKYFAPDAGSFPMGSLSPSLRSEIVISSLAPSIWNLSFRNVDARRDDLRLEDAFKDELRSQALFMYAERADPMTAYEITGDYRVVGPELIFNGALVLDNCELSPPLPEIRVSLAEDRASAVKSLAAKIHAAVASWLKVQQKINRAA